MNIMADCEAAISVTASGPKGWGKDPSNTSLYTQASYSTFGKANFAGPGGNYDLFFEDPDSLCSVGYAADSPCWFFDMAFSTGNGGWYWNAGTSMAAPGAAGVAALIISENGKSMKPAQVRTEMERRALDFGKPGYDDFYGQGHVHSGHYF